MFANAISSEMPTPVEDNKVNAKAISCRAHDGFITIYHSSDISSSERCIIMIYRSSEISPQLYMVVVSGGVT